MYRDPRLYLEDILISIQKIARFTDSISFETLVKDEMRLDAVVRNLEIIGEASKRIPCKFKESRD